MSKLKKAIKVVVKGTTSLVAKAVAKMFMYGFEHASFACYWYQNPDGDKDGMVQFFADNVDYMIEHGNKWIDEHIRENNKHYCGECKYFALCNDEALKRDNAKLDPYSDACSEFEEV